MLYMGIECVREDGRDRLSSPCLKQLRHNYYVIDNMGVRAHNTHNYTVHIHTLIKKTSD